MTTRVYKPPKTSFKKAIPAETLRLPDFKITGAWSWQGRQPVFLHISSGFPSKILHSFLVSQINYWHINFNYTNILQQYSEVVFNKNYLCGLIDSSDTPLILHVAFAEFKPHYGDSRLTIQFRIVRGLCNDSRAVYFYIHTCALTLWRTVAWYQL